jgi:hypothetical protein
MRRQITFTADNVVEAMSGALKLRGIRIGDDRPKELTGPHEVDVVMSEVDVVMSVKWFIIISYDQYQIRRRNPVPIRSPEEL